MILLEDIIDVLYDVGKKLLCLTILAGVIFFGSNVVKDYNENQQLVKNQEEQMQELINNQAYTLALLEEYQKLNLVFISTIAKDFNNKTKKPSYELLTSSSVYLFRPDNVLEMLDESVRASKKLDGEGIKGSVGSGIVVAEKNGYKYILTNKHVCDEKDSNTCFLLNNGEIRDPIRLEFVKRIQSEHDLALWKTDANLPKLKPIKGIAQAYPQERVFSVGNYLGMKKIYTEGTVAGVDDGYIFFNTPCAGGCSGSGVFNSDGELVGVIFAGFRISPFQSDTAKIIAVDSKIVRLFLKDLLEE